jgi:hypothetical protein
MKGEIVAQRQGILWVFLENNVLSIGNGDDACIVQQLGCSA